MFFGPKVKIFEKGGRPHYSPADVCSDRGRSLMGEDPGITIVEEVIVQVPFHIGEIPGNGKIYTIPYHLSGDAEKASDRRAAAVCTNQVTKPQGFGAGSQQFAG